MDKEKEAGKAITDEYLAQEFFETWDDEARNFIRFYVETAMVFALRRRDTVMSMKTLETAIIKELRTITGNPKLTMDSVMEWSTLEGSVRKYMIEKNEQLFHCPEIGVWVAVKKSALPGE